MKPTVFFTVEIFDPRQVTRAGLQKQVYTSSLQAGEGITLERDDRGVYVCGEHDGERFEYFVPYSGVRQTLNVKERHAAKSKAQGKAKK